MEATKAKKCKNCGSDVIGRRPQALYCSDKCAKGAYYHRHKTPSINRKKCKGCGKGLEHRRKDAVWCSNNCHVMTNYHKKRGGFKAT